MIENKALVDAAAEISKDLAKEVYSDGLQPTVQNVGGTLGTFSGFFNHVVMYPLKKLNILFEQKAIAFEKELERKYKEIPEANRVEPQLHIVGPTMESLKYNISEDTLAELFSNLLISNMDSRTQGLCTPSFVKAVEELSPCDAKVFQAIYEAAATERHLPVCRIKLYCKESDRVISDEYVPRYLIGFNIVDTDIKQVAKSIQNLVRLGLFEIDQMRWKKDDAVYNQMIAREEIKKLNDWANNITGKSFIPEVTDKGLIIVNDFAIDFARVCLRK